MTSNYNDENNFPQKLLIINRQVASLAETFANNLPANAKLLKTQISKIIPLGGFLLRHLGPLINLVYHYLKP